MSEEMKGNMQAVGCGPNPHYEGRFDGETEELAELRRALAKDAERLDFIEQQIRKSRTGVSFDWVPSVDGDPSGYRMMWRHKIHEQKKTLRAAIDEAMRETCD